MISSNMDLDQPSNMVIYVALQKSNIKFAIGTNVLLQDVPIYMGR